MHQELTQSCDTPLGTHTRSSGSPPGPGAGICLASRCWHMCHVRLSELHPARQ